MSKRTRKLWGASSSEEEAAPQRAASSLNEALADEAAEEAPDIPSDEIPEWRKRKEAEDRKLDERFRPVTGTWLARRWGRRPNIVTARQLRRWGFDHKRLLATGVIRPAAEE